MIEVLVLLRHQYISTTKVAVKFGFHVQLALAGADDGCLDVCL